MHAAATGSVGRSVVVSVGIERAQTTCRTERAARQDVHRSPWLAGRVSGAWDVRMPSQSSAILTHILSILARLLQKLQHRLSWPLSGACVHFVSWGGTTENGQWRCVSRRLTIVNLRALHRMSVRGMYGIRATCCRCVKSWQLARPEQIARMNKKEGHHAADETDKTSVRWGSGGSAR